jgi:hypothetical protein
MPTPGLSLVGFLDQTAAITHLRDACVAPDPAEAALIAVWNSAKARLGPPIPGAGQPDIKPIPQQHEPYIQQLCQTLWLQPLLNSVWQGASFRLVEIDKLLAYQFSVDVNRSGHHCGVVSKPPTLAEMLPICLPHNPPSEDFAVIDNASRQSVLIKARSLNVLTVAQGRFPDNRVGIAVGLASPLVHVVRNNGKCYLHNGYHRAYGLGRAGATHVPCIFRDVTDHASVGIKSDGSTFSAALLESNDPPALAHVTQGRAQVVSMRAMSRVIHVTWAEYAVPDE